MSKYLLFLILVLLLLIGAIIYQQDILKKMQNTLREEILNEWKKQKELEERIKEEVESKRKTQEFLSQLDYEKKLVDSFQQELKDLDNRIQTNLSDLKESFLKELNIQKQDSKLNQERLFSFEEKLKDLIKNLSSQLEDFKKRDLQLKREIAEAWEELDHQKSQQQQKDRSIEASIGEILSRLSKIEEKQNYLESKCSLKNDSE